MQIPFKRVWCHAVFWFCNPQPQPACVGLFYRLFSVFIDIFSHRLVDFFSFLNYQISYTQVIYLYHSLKGNHFFKIEQK